MSQVIHTKAKPPGITVDDSPHVRYTDLRILYNGVKVNSSFGTIESFQYEDPAKDESDSIDIKVDNIDERWSNGWYPKKFDRIYCGIQKHNKNGKESELNCGLFLLDSRNISGPPKVCTIRGLSIPIAKSFSDTPRTKTWHSVTLQQICQEKAADNGITLTWESDLSDSIETVEQTNQTDSAFLKEICGKYDLMIKTYTLSMIIYDQAKMEDKEAVATIHPENCSQYSSDMDIKGSYTGAISRYTDSNTNRTYEVRVGDVTSASARVLYLNETCDSEADATKKAVAKVNQSNRETYQMSVTLKEPIFLYAIQNVKFEGFGSDIDGKYFIDKVTHDVSASGGYSVQFSAHWCTSRITADGTSVTEDTAAEAQKAEKDAVKKAESDAKKAAKKSEKKAADKK